MAKQYLIQTFEPGGLGWQTLYGDPTDGRPTRDSYNTFTSRERAEKYAEYIALVFYSMKSDPSAYVRILVSEVSDWEPVDPEQGDPPPDE